MFLAKADKARVNRIFNLDVFEKQKPLSGELDAVLIYEIIKDALARASASILSDASLSLPNKSKSSFRIELVTSIEEWTLELKQSSYSVGFSTQFVKRANSFKYSVVPVFQEDDFDAPFFQAFVLNALFFSGAINSFMFTAERTGISLFSKELALGRLKDVTRDNVPRYPKAISEALAFAEDRAHISQRKSPFADISQTIEKEIIRGTVNISEDGAMSFMFGDTEISHPMSSSTSKALGDFLFYLKHRAEKQSMIVVDEPEIHLHPNNQIILTRLFARMINRGLRLVMTTHSDHIIREINNLIMLHTVGSRQKERLSLGYAKEEYLDYKDVRAYLFEWKGKKVHANPILIESDGFAVSSIDTVIGSINDIAERLYVETMQNQ